MEPLHKSLVISSFDGNHGMKCVGMVNATIRAFTGIEADWQRQCYHHQSDNDAMYLVCRDFALVLRRCRLELVFRCFRRMY